MADPCSAPVPATCSPAGVNDPRVLDFFTRRFNRATIDAQTPIAAHTANDDEAAYADKCGTYSKVVLQASAGVVDPDAFAKFRAACNSGKFDDFEAVPLGQGRTLNGPMASYSYAFLGLDNSQFGVDAVPPAPALASEDYATELIELYWCSLLRDVAFADYHGNQIATEAAKELDGLPTYQGPKDTHTGKVTPRVLFRGGFAGETVGPYVSQFFVTPTMLGAQPIDQRYVTYKTGLDYMTDPGVWEAVQNGFMPPYGDVAEPVPQYLHNGRGLAAYTHVDELFQAYFTAYLVLRSTNVPFNPGNPYAHSKTQNGFGTFGPPDFAAILAHVAKIALNAVWYQKWVIHLRHRPESGGGLVHFINHGKVFDGAPSATVFNSKALARSAATYGSYLLSQAFPEGSPAHPAYPTGHGTVGGACITILKFFFKGEYVLSNPQYPTSDGTGLQSWKQKAEIGEPGVLTVDGELHKLAHNVTFGHGLHGGIHWRSDSDVSMQLGEAVAIAYLQDLACTYAEKFSVTFTKLDGTPQVISN